MTLRSKIVNATIAWALLEPRLAFAEPARAGETSTASLTVEFEVDTSKVTVLADLITRRVLHQAGIRAGEASLPQASGARARVRVVILPTAKELGYEYQVIATLDGTLVPISESSGVCDPCTHEMVAKRVDAVFPRQLAALREATRRPARVPDVAQPAKASPTPNVVHDETQPSDVPPDRRLGVLGQTGIAVGGVGVAAVVVGAIFAARPPKREREPGDATRVRLSDRHTLGYTLVGVGAAAVLGGVVMIVVDGVNHKRRPSARAVRLAPQVGAVGVGMLLMGRF